MQNMAELVDEMFFKGKGNGFSRNLMTWLQPVQPSFHLSALWPGFSSISHDFSVLGSKQERAPVDSEDVT